MFFFFLLLIVVFVRGNFLCYVCIWFHGYTRPMRIAYLISSGERGYWLKINFAQVHALSSSVESSIAYAQFAFYRVSFFHVIFFSRELLVLEFENAGKNGFWKKKTKTNKQINVINLKKRGKNPFFWGKKTLKNLGNIPMELGCSENVKFGVLLKFFFLFTGFKQFECENSFFCI